MELMSFRGGVVQAVPSDDIESEVNLYRRLPFSYAETARSRQQVFVIGAASRWGDAFQFGVPSEGDALPTDPTGAPTGPDLLPTRST